MYIWRCCTVIKLEFINRQDVSIFSAINFGSFYLHTISIIHYVVNIKDDIHKEFQSGVYKQYKSKYAITKIKNGYIRDIGN